MSQKPKAAQQANLPELLRDRSERTLRLVLRAIVEAHPDQLTRTDEARIETAFSALVGRRPPRGAAPQHRDELLEHLAFDYSIEDLERGKNISVTMLASRLVNYHPSTKDRAEKASIVRDLVRKFAKHRAELLRDYSYDSSSIEPFSAVRKILEALEEANVVLERRVVPPGYWRGDISEI